MLPIAWWFLLVPMTAISALLYYLGGESGWDTKVRDWGCNTLAVAMLLAAGHSVNGWAMLACWGLLWGALSTYWKQGPDAKWYHWALTGLGYGLAMTPFAWCTGHWIGLAVYTALLAISVCVWSQTQDKVLNEAAGRGAFIIIYLPALFIG